MNAGRALFKVARSQGLIKKSDHKAITHIMYGFFIGPIQTFHMASQIDNKPTGRGKNDEQVATLINMIIDTIGDALSVK